ncbi:MAG: MerR family transcriptional regulator [Gammaproteobacteria bacterium]|nr:MerR family transcriptional regulator [Gammaproteobacteria bacterium]
MNKEASPNEDRYGIGAVAKLTGLTDHTIRVWERRYGAVVAQRAANGRRVYGPEEVEKLGLLKRLTDRGLSIGQIANDDMKKLRERVESMKDIASTPLPDHIGIAILGDFLPGRIADSDNDLAPVEIVVADDNRETFVADLARHQVDVVVLESPVLDDSVTSQLVEYMDRAGAARGVIVYSFGRLRDVDLARDSRIVVLRSPVSIDEVQAAVIRACAPPAASQPKSASAPEAAESVWQFSGPVAPRRFNNQQLTRLTRASTAIDCECPHHLAQLVGDLTAFEVYSAQCANRDEEDAALHRYLHQTTAQARALIEVALERVAEAEGIDY